MKKNLLLLLPAMSLASLAWSQDLSPRIISPAGGIDHTNQITFNWTLGELAVSTVTYPDGIHTEGFNQPSLRITGMQNENPNSNFSIVVSPNPVQAMLNVKIRSTEDSRLMLTLVDVNGKKCVTLAAESLNDSKDLDLSDFPSGLYMLHVRNASGTILKIYKISKIQ